MWDKFRLMWHTVLLISKISSSHTRKEFSSRDLLPCTFSSCNMQACICQIMNYIDKNTNQKNRKISRDIFLITLWYCLTDYCRIQVLSRENILLFTGSTIKIRQLQLGKTISKQINTTILSSTYLNSFSKEILGKKNCRNTQLKKKKKISFTYYQQF